MKKKVSKNAKKPASKTILRKSTPPTEKKFKEVQTSILDDEENDEDDLEDIQDETQEDEEIEDMESENLPDVPAENETNEGIVRRFGYHVAYLKNGQLQSHECLNKTELKKFIVDLQEYKIFRGKEVKPKQRVIITF